MKEPLFNQRFGDIYFSPDDGLAETRHVFLAGNGLPARWQGRPRFTIAETGFGTGLNFLAAWTLFDETAAPGQCLEYVSFECDPLPPETIRGALERWTGALGGRLERFLACYPLRIAGFHRIRIAPHIALTLAFDDVNAALPELQAPEGIDAWFLDGFAPAKNPQMWTDTLFTAMAGRSAKDATAATFTAAGAVRRGLAAAGFAVEKRPGFGRKRDMTIARFIGANPAVSRETETYRINSGKIAVIGAGLAGTAASRALAASGRNVVLFERNSTIAPAASGNPAGLYNPRFTASRTPESAFYAAGYARAAATIAQTASRHDIGHAACGTLHLATGPEKEKRFAAMAGESGWHPDHIRLLDPGEASAAAGINTGTGGLFLPDSGRVSPAALCAAFIRDAAPDLRLNAPAIPVRTGSGWRIGDETFDIVILATAANTAAIPALSWLPLQTVRGQISVVNATAQSQGLRCNLCYGGYLSAPSGGRHVIGATFQKWLTDTDLRDDDHRLNLENLESALPGLRAGMTVRGGRAALRAATPDRFPLIGPLCDEKENPLPGLYVTAGHGSHGIISSLAGAQLLETMIAGAPYSLPRATIEALSPARFLQRARRKAQNASHNQI